MSERREKRKRRMWRASYQYAYQKWLSEKPPIILFWRWWRWRKSAPKMEDFKW